MIRKVFPLLCLLICAACSDNNTDYKNPKLSPEQRADNLLSQMTLDEKVAQLQCCWFDKRGFFTDGKFDTGKAGKYLKDGIGVLARMNEDMDITKPGYHNTLHPRQAAEQYNEVQKFFIEKTRLGIPFMNHEEGLHGQQSVDATTFPVPIALASSWNEELVYNVYRCVAKELRARGCGEVLAPVLDVVRDPRWGRTEECMGEDPYVNARLGIQQVKAYQGDKVYLDDEHVGATMKHFGVHGQSEGGVNVAPSFVDEIWAHEVFLKPFRDVIDETQPMNVMITYNDIWGQPAHRNKHLLQDILRKEFGFKGLVVSDYDGIANLKNLNRITDSMDEAGALCLEAGIDIEYPMITGFKNLAELVKTGRLSESTIDAAVKRILIEKFRLGLFERPYLDPDKAERIVGCVEHRKVAYQAAVESMVLLKNDDSFLPIDKDKYKTIAFIGPNADRCILGGYSSQPKDTITPLRAIREKYGEEINILYAEGVKLTDLNSPFPATIKLCSAQDNAARIAQAIGVAERADLVVLFVGGNEGMSREAYAPEAPGDLPSLELMAGQKELISKITALHKPTCAFVNGGTTYNLQPLEDAVPAIMQCWYLGQETGYAVVDALFGDINPSGKLTISFPRSAGHIPCYYSYISSSRRGYNLDYGITPLYPFGYGLSYTTYEYSGLKINKEVMHAGETVEVSIIVKNTGARDGDEVVQMYIRDDLSSMSRPIKELKGFKKIHLAAGEQQVVNFTIDKEQLAFYDRNLNWQVEPGTFTVMVGPSSMKCDTVTFSYEL